jgi:hypothetical protein
MILGDGTEVWMGNTYGQGEVGDKRGSKEMDRCPLTYCPSLLPLSETINPARNSPGLHWNTLGFIPAHNLTGLFVWFVITTMSPAPTELALLKNK